MKRIMIIGAALAALLLAAGSCCCNRCTGKLSDEGCGKCSATKACEGCPAEDKTCCGGETKSCGEDKDCCGGKVLLSVKDLDGAWVAVEMGGKAVEGAVTVTFNADKMSFGANAGCNTIGGRIELKARRADSIEFADILSTLMACEDETNERALISALHNTRSFYGKKCGKVCFCDSEDSTVLVLARAAKAE